jgi:hypothetical protein
MPTNHTAKRAIVQRIATSTMCFGPFTTRQNPGTEGVCPPNSVAIVGPSDLLGMEGENTDAPTGLVNEERITRSVGFSVEHTQEPK